MKYYMVITELTELILCLRIWRRKKSWEIFKGFQNSSKPSNSFWVLSISYISLFV